MARSAGKGRPDIHSEYRSAVARAIITAVNALSAGGAVGRRRLINFLRGSEPPRPGKDMRPDDAGYAVLQCHGAGWLEEALERLLEEGYLTLSPGRFASGRLFSLSPLGKSSLRGRALFPERVLPFKPRLGSNPEIEERLRALRRDLAAAEERAPYSIFPNSVLAELASRCPSTLGDLALVPGLGEARIRKYGRKILGTLKG